MRTSWLSALVGVVGLLVAGTAHAQSYAYPIPWPQAGGGTIVVVPVSDADLSIYHRTAMPQGSGWGDAFDTTPESMMSLSAGVPVVIRAPDGVSPPANQDDFFVFLSTSKLIVSVADDERYNPGSPDRIFFMPATSGTFRGRTFYGHCSAGWSANRIRVYNLSGTESTAEFSAWDGSAWVSAGTVSVPASDMVVFDPPATYPDTAYRVVTTEDALVVEGYLADNATAPAVNPTTGLTVGDELWGYGHAYDVRAIDAVDYTIEYRAETSGSWTSVATGSLAAGEHIAGVVPGAPSAYTELVDEVEPGFQIRMQFTGGSAWAITGTPSTAWNGYFVPTQSHDACVFGNLFYTFGAARTLVVLPNPGTTVKIFDQNTDTMLDEHTSTVPWEFHHFWDARAQRVEVTDGPGAVMPIGVPPPAPCSAEGVDSTNCGILEGGYSVPAVGGFECGEFATSLVSCAFTSAHCSELVPPPEDGGMPDAGIGDAGVRDASHDAAFDAASSDAGVPPLGGDTSDSCGCVVPGRARVRSSSGFLLFAGVLLVGWSLRTSRRRERARTP